MDMTVRRHIEVLECRIRDLWAEMMNTKDRGRLNTIEAEIRIANMALEHYRTALKLESDLGRIP